MLRCLGPGSLPSMAAVEQSIRVFVCVEADPNLPRRAGKACDNPVCTHLTPPSIQNPSLASAHRELAAARRVSSRGRLHQGLRLLHVDDSMRRGGSVMSGVSPPAPQPAANARRSRRLAQPRTRPRWPLRRFAANRIFEPITNWPPRFVSVLFPNSPPKTKALLPAQSRSAFPPATDPSFASAHQRKKRAGTHHLQSRQPKSAAT